MRMDDPAITTVLARDRRSLLRALLFVTLCTCVAGWLFKAHCAFDGGWSGGEQYLTGCYSDAMPFWQLREMAAGRLPYLEARMEYPVLTGALIWFDGALTRLLFGAHAGAPHFLFAVSLANTALALVVTWLLWTMRLAEPRLWCWALAPPLVLYLGHNWDLLAITLTIAGLALAQRSRTEASAGLLGLAAAAKFFPVFILPLLGFRDLLQRRFGRVLAIGLVAAGSWTFVNVPIAAVARDNWLEFYRFSSDRAPTAASLWASTQAFGWTHFSPARLNLVSGLAFALGAIAITLAGWWRHRTPLWVLAGPVVAWFLLTNKVYSPQFDLWLYPLLLIATPRLAPVALFVVGDIAAYFAEFWMFAGMENGWPAVGQGTILAAALVRAIALLWVIGEVLARPAPPWCDQSSASVAASRSPA